MGIIGDLLGMGRGRRAVVEEARRALDRGAVLIDVRSPAEFASGHIEGARNIPVDELPGRLSDLGTAREAIVYCRSGLRSASAARALRGAGLTVHDVGPMSAWDEACAPGGGCCG